MWLTCVLQGEPGYARIKPPSGDEVVVAAEDLLPHFFRGQLVHNSANIKVPAQTSQLKNGCSWLTACL